MKNILRAIAVGGAMVFATSAAGMATIEFMQLGAGDQYDAVKPIMVSFLKAGYRKVPDNEILLIVEIRKLAFEKGYTYQSVDDVAKEAALRMGMTR